MWYNLNSVINKLEEKKKSAANVPAPAEAPTRDGPPRQLLGLGRELLARLVQYGRDEGMHRIVADILPENTGMIRVSEQLGFKITRVPDDDTLRAELVL